MNKKITIIASAILVVVIALIITLISLVSNNVVATVNGQEISNKELKERVTQFEQTLTLQGQEVNMSEEEMRLSVLDQIISETLLYQESVKAGFDVEESEIDQEVQDIRDSIGGDEAFRSRLKEAGISEEDLRRDIRNNILINSYLESVLSDVEVSVTDQELVEFYDSLNEQQELSPFEEIEEDLRNSLLSEKENELISEIVMELYNNSEVEVSL
ncbi:MAG: SurA N-terminal domain-containing protein [Candidatus Paceibacterota bacterium]